jgi:hypothetical protein
MYGTLQSKPNKAQDSSPCIGPVAACTGSNQQICMTSCAVHCRRQRTVLVPAAELAAAGPGRAVAQCQRECAPEVPCSRPRTHMPNGVLKASYDSVFTLPRSADIYISVFLDRLLVRRSKLYACKTSALGAATIMMCLRAALNVHFAPAGRG